MKYRLAKKIMSSCLRCNPYLRQVLCGVDITKELPKFKHYWEPRWALYYASKGGGYGRADHRIVKAEKITARYSRKLTNCLVRLAGKTLFEIGDIMSSANKIKSFGV